MNRKIAELLAEKERNEQKLEQLEHQQAMIENKIAYLSKGDRRKRAHRLITRGAAVESLVPAVKDMDEVDFYELMETILTHPAVRPLLPEAEEDGAVPLSHGTD